MTRERESLHKKSDEMRHGKTMEGVGYAQDERD
jgi:hypothetical protein